jgi:2-polyprenyl-3-methyl-5-hydroxy-6-metoxy-1,4-benzoquinol methylase
MNISKQTIDNIYKYVIDSDNKELEVRFGKFDNQGKFTSNIDIYTFYKIKNILSENTSYKQEHIITKEEHFTNVKKITNLNDNSVYYLQKKRISKIDITDYNIRIALSNEKIVNKFDELHDNISFTRNKDRYSFIDQNMKIDMTIIDLGDKKEFELELEVIQSDTPKDILFKALMHKTNDLLYLIQGNSILIDTLEKEYVLNLYSQMTKSKRFVGAQPHTLQKAELEVLYKNRYSVTEKLDGDRTFVLIDNNNIVYLIDNNLNNIYKTNLSTKTIKNCILDGELLQSGLYNKHFHIFDILFFDGNDLRKNKEYNLYDRLGLCMVILEDLKYLKTDFFEMSLKTYFFDNVFLGSEIILDNPSLHTDGLIFTPIDEPYIPIKNNILKWKPVHQNSIDFFAIKKGDHWDLFVLDKDGLVLFDVNELCPPEENNSLVTFFTTFDDTLTDPLTHEVYKTNTVIEFVWDFTHNKFMPLRTRWDKTFNPAKHGNFYTVACSNWKSIHNPVTKELLFRTGVNLKSNPDIHFKNMRFFHNRIKDYLYDTYTKNTNSLLELSSGKGGDLNKWVKNKVKFINGYDLSAISIAECEKRVREKRMNLDYHFYQQDLLDPLSSDIIKEQAKGLYDNVMCNFAIHYYFEKKSHLDNIISICNKNLKEGGHFIMTFMDKNEVENLVPNKIGYFLDPITLNILYYIKKEPNTWAFGNKIKIVLGGNNILTKGSDEYIVDFEFLVNYMLENGYSLVESKLFKDIKGSNSMSPVEKDISFLNRYCVFKKTTNTETCILSESKMISEPLKKVSLSNLQNNKELTVHKIESLYDIINLVDCLSYKYNKTQIENKMIMSYIDISNLFQQLNLQTPNKTLQPFFINTYGTNTENSDANYITFLNYTYNTLTEIEEENTILNNWYIVLYNHNIITNPHDIKVLLDLSDFQPNITVNLPEPILEAEVSELEGIQKLTIDPKIDKLKQLILAEIEKRNYKLSENQVKKFLQKCELSIDGTFIELFQRLISFIKN